jgi:hypothetical protein
LSRADKVVDALQETALERADVDAAFRDACMRIITAYAEEETIDNIGFIELRGRQAGDNFVLTRSITQCFCYSEQYAQMCAHGPAPSLSPLLDIDYAGLILSVRSAGQHLLPLDAYLRDLPVIPDGDFGPVQMSQIRAAERFLADPDLWSDYTPLEVPGLTGLRVVATPRRSRNLVLLEGEEGIACVRTGLPYVAPAHRDRGIGALLVLISDINGGRFLHPVSYSESGVRARRSAHALQVRIVTGTADAGATVSAKKETGAEAPVPVS